jgi:hypothetical protein
VGLKGLSVPVQKISPLPGFDPRTLQPVASRYTDCAIPPYRQCYPAPQQATTVGKLEPYGIQESTLNWFKSSEYNDPTNALLYNKTLI